MNPTDLRLIDASVWVASTDPADRFYASARAVVADYARPLATLDLTLYEVANVMGGKRGRPTEGRFLVRLIARRCRDNLVVAEADLLESAVELAAEHGLTAYDAAYVAAARRRGWTFVSCDVADLVSKGLAVTPDSADYP